MSEYITPYEVFIKEAKLVKTMARSFDEFEVKVFNGETVQVDLLATLMKFNHLVELFKKISFTLRNKYASSYDELNSILEEDEYDTVEEILNGRNRIAHTLSEKALINPPFEMRTVYNLTEDMQNIIAKYIQHYGDL